MNEVSYDTDVLLKVKHLSKCIRKDYDERLAEYGLTSQQGRILFFVINKNKDNQEVHQNDIEEKFFLSKSSVSEIIGRMIKAEFLKKEKRCKFCVIEATDKGEEVIENILKHRQEIIKKLFFGFSAKEIETISKNIDIMINNMGKENEYVRKDQIDSKISKAI